MCKHDEWMKMCVLCGEVLETTENKSSVVASAEMNKTVYVAAQPSAQRIGCTCRKNERGEITKYHAGCPEHDPANR